MTKLLIENKKYVLLTEKDYLLLQKSAALKSKPEKTLTIKEARQYSKALINKWAEK